MRVSRRIRPSQVGCAASASRRRLQAATLGEAHDTTEQRALPRPALVIHPNGQIVSLDAPRDVTVALPAYDEAEAVAVSNARG